MSLETIGQLLLSSPAVFCDEKKIPAFRNGSAVGTIDWEERKEEDPASWNSFERRLTYTCPVGFVIERPLEYKEQQDPIPEEQESFEVECAEDARWTARPLHGGTVIPVCIRESLVLHTASHPDTDL